MATSSPVARENKLYESDAHSHPTGRGPRSSYASTIPNWCARVTVTMLNAACDSQRLQLIIVQAPWSPSSPRSLVRMLVGLTWERQK
jgi:hypothetical protein